MLNRNVKSLAKILKEHLQSVAKIIMGPEQAWALKDRTIQSNMHLNCTILEGVKNDDRATLINLNNFRSFDTADNQYLTAIL